MERINCVTPGITNHFWKHGGAELFTRRIANTSPMNAATATVQNYLEGVGEHNREQVAYHVANLIAQLCTLRKLTSPLVAERILDRVPSLALN